LYFLPNISSVIKEMGLRSTGPIAHVSWMGNTQNFIRKPQGKRPLGKSRSGWKDNGS